MKCELCGQDHSLAMKCIGAKGGRHAKDPEQQRRNANKRWEGHVKKEKEKPVEF